MSDTLIFQISARNIDPEIVISELGLGTSISRTGTGCIWHFEISKPVSKNQPDRLIREILNRFAGKKAFLRSLRDGGSDLVII